MKITPSEIRQKTFSKKALGGGYDREEVSGFLILLAQEWEKLLDDSKEKQIRVQFLEKEIDKLKEVETSLFKTLKTAEETSTHMVEQARKTADLKVRDAQIKADVILNDAREQAKSVVQKAQQKARNLMSEVLDELKIKEKDYHLLENYRDNLTMDLKGLMNDVLEKVKKVEDRSQSHDYFGQKLQEARLLAEQSREQWQANHKNTNQENKAKEIKEEKKENPQTDNSEVSFFDNLDA